MLPQGESRHEVRMQYLPLKSRDKPQSLNLDVILYHE